MFVEKAGQLESVILSAEQYPAFQAVHDKASRAARKQAFEAEFGDWIAAHNARVDAHGVPGADLRPLVNGCGSIRRFPNPSRSASEGIPYPVVIQSELLDGLATRLTVPLAELDFAGKVPTALCPVITVSGRRLHAPAHYAAPLPAKLLRHPVDNAATHASALVAAMDAVLSGIR